MPRLSVWFVRTGLLYLAAGFTVGGLLLFNKGLPLHPLMWRLLPAHIELLLLGWTLNLALGVAYWILPRYKTGPPRGSETPVWLAYGLLNGGVAAICLAPWLGLSEAGQAGLITLGKVAETLAAAAFAGHILPRIKPHGV
ncbi:MAG: hypothetical protein IT317_03160 [Anaerolineales bacterium]|nr:hypothetical protein [Anaerolineales bacterium]